MPGQGATDGWARQHVRRNRRADGDRRLMPRVGCSVEELDLEVVGEDYRADEFELLVGVEVADGSSE